MSKSGIDRLRSLAEQFRAAIVRCPKEMLPVALQRFPRGACGTSCDLLGQYLIDSEHSSVEYICGHRGIQSHAWLLVEGLIIDITANQFQEIGSEIIIKKGSRFHKSFIEDFRRQGGIWRDEQYSQATLESTYQEIRSRIIDC
ncbi:MAG TPA: hypothetical protein DD435_10160 [Cyanobacteria bacterium UBA8530]|nr:hypothetical protein [Cyanobacteria bacterium UBA8530]